MRKLWAWMPRNSGKSCKLIDSSKKAAKEQTQTHLVIYNLWMNEWMKANEIKQAPFCLLGSLMYMALSTEQGTFGIFEFFH